MTTYNIALPKKLTGSELAAAMKEAASKLKWRYRQEVNDVSVTYGSVNLQTNSVHVSINNGRFVGEEARVVNPIKLNEKYSELQLESYFWGQKHIKRFAEALHDVLQPKFTNLFPE